MKDFVNYMIIIIVAVMCTGCDVRISISLLQPPLLLSPRVTPPRGIAIIHAPVSRPLEKVTRKVTPSGKSD